MKHPSLLAVLLFVSGGAQAQFGELPKQPKFQKKADGPAPQAVPAAPVDLRLSQCYLDPDIPLMGGWRLVRYGHKGWSVYTDNKAPGDDETASNNTQLCVYGTNRLFFPGIVGAADISVRRAGGENATLVVRTALVEPGRDGKYRGARWMEPKDLIDTRVENGKLVLASDSSARAIDMGSSYEYLIPVARLEGKLKEAGGVLNVVRAARVKLPRDQKHFPGYMTVYLSEGEDHRFELEKTLSANARGTACADEGGIVAPKLLNYLNAALGDRKFLQVAFIANDKINEEPPNVVFSCKVGAENNSDWILAAPSWRDPGKYLRASDSR